MLVAPALDRQKPWKNLGFSKVFITSACCTQDKKRRKIAPGACRTELPTKIMLKTRLGARQTPFWMGLWHSWVPLGRCLARFWPLLGGSWCLLGASWAPLGRFLGALGRLLAGLKHVLGAFCLPGTSQASILEGLGTCWAGFGKALGAYFAMSFAASRALLHNAFMYAVNTLLHLPTFLLLPLWCGGLCAAHGIRRTAVRCPGVSNQYALIWI